MMTAIKEDVRRSRGTDGNGSAGPQPEPQGARHLTVGRLQQRLLTADAIIADPLEMLAALTKETTTIW